MSWTTKKKNTLESLPEVDSILILKGISKNPEYGYSPKHPIKLGVTSEYTSATYPEKYLQSITGPQGQAIAYERIRSCCFFKTVNSDAAYQNVGVLEVYQVTYEGLTTPKLLYLNFFDEGIALVPQGFLPKKLPPTNQLSNSSSMHAINLFALLVVMNFLLSLGVNRLVLTEDIYYYALIDTLPEERIHKLLTSQKKYEWILYSFGPVISALKLFLMAACIYTGFFFRT